MGRLVNYRPRAVPGAAEAAAAGPTDGFVTRVGKLVPAEVVAFYLPLSKIIEGTASRLPKETLYWILFGIALVATPLYVKRRGRIEAKPWKTHALLTTIAFLAWTYALGGPWGWIYDPVAAAMALGAVDLLTGAVFGAFLDEPPAPAPPP